MNDMTEQQIKDLKAEVFDLLERQNTLQNEIRSLEQIKIKKIEEIQKLRTGNRKQGD